METSTHSSARRARWGLLITTVLMGAALVGTGVAGFLGARQSMEQVIRSRSSDLLLAVRRSLRESGPPSPDAFDDILVEMEEQGLRYLAVVDSPGVPFREAGVTTFDPLYDLNARVEHGIDVAIADDGNAVRAIARLMTARPRKPHHKQRRGDGRSWRARQFRRWQRWPRPTPYFLVIEFEPVVATAIEARALTTLIVGLLASLLLLVATAVFWRLSVREETAAAQLARDQQLKQLGEMSAVLGHEIRNPLTSLKGHAQLLVEKLDGHHASEKAELVVSEAVRLERLTGQVLDFARSGTLDLELQDVRSLVATACEGAGSERVRLVSSQAVPPCRLDAPRMAQVLGNLLHNALDASPPEKPVEVSIGAADGQVYVEVRDHGEGVPPEDRERIFEPFHTNRLRGTGLGLTVAKRIIEGHAGSIDVRNHDEGGAIFRVRLPQNEGGG